MSRAHGWLVAGVLALLGASTHATSIFEFDLWMDDIEDRSLSLQKALERQDAATSIADAREIERLYALMQGYFEPLTRAEEAVRLSREGRELTMQIAQHAEAQRFARASDAMAQLMRDCRTCHNQFKPLKDFLP